MRTTIIALIILASLIASSAGTYAYATNENISVQKIQTLQGFVTTVTGGFTIESLTWSMPGYNASATSNCTWPNGGYGACHTAFTAADWELWVVVTINTVPTTTTNYTITLSEIDWCCPVGYSINFTVPNTVTPGTSENFFFGTTTTTLPSTISTVLTIS